ncbi:glycosyltransferase family protein [Falsibacillus albus]|uniref:Glycosyltransferase n=1 Tax=Falsibacillus albus TaxID=2478915 RepID=A0A3L7JVR5_9BACI|nr:hypothetical protein [Falsibacillus albus]RLQ94813.1 hypothetical protein D9X91_12530 [Falsibacillus albus]
MNVLFLDFLYPKGHQRFSKDLIKYLSDIYDVNVIAKQGYYIDFTDDLQKVNKLEEHNFKIGDNWLLSRISSLNVMLKSAIFIKKNKSDYILVSSFDTITFAIGKIFFRNKDKMYIVHHNNVDELDNKYKLKIFKSYMNNVNHIVLEGFIKDYLVNEIGVNKKNVFVLPHPLYINETCKEQREKYLCIGLSNSNDEYFIEQIIKTEKENKKFLNSRKKVILKSKKYEFDNGYLKVVKGYLKKEKYDEYVSNSEYIFMPFPDTFCYRMSGTLMDALSNKKIVLGSDIPLMRYYTRKYPSICKIIKDASAFFYFLLNSEQNATRNAKEFHSFNKFHSKENITRVLSDILKER